MKTMNFKIRMVQHHFKMSYRRLAKFKTNSIINIVGLSIAIAVCMIISVFNVYHFSFDRYVKNGGNSYRLISRLGDGTYHANTFACFDDILPAYSEVEGYTTCYTMHNIDDVFVNNRKIKVDEAIFANSSFFDFFSVKVLEGVKESINQPNTMMVTSEMAQKLYPDTSAIGQTVLLRSFTVNQDSLIVYTITGITQSLPETSHIGFEILLSQKGHFSTTIEAAKQRKVFAGNVYLKLCPNVKPGELEKKLGEKAGEILKESFGPPAEAFNFHLQPLYKIHFTPDTIMELRPSIRHSILNILLLVGAVILIIASVNFVNMYIARAAFHQKESTIIRFLGGSSLHIAGDRFVEIIIAITLSFILSFFLLAMSKNIISHSFLMNWDLNLTSQRFWFSFVSLYLGVIIVVLIIELFKFSQMIQQHGQVILPSRNRRLVPLVVFQFIIVIMLVGFTLVVNKQLYYIKNKQLGYTPDNVMVIQMPQQSGNVKLFRDELLKSPYILSASSVHHYPGFRLQDMTFTNQGTSFPFKFGFVDQYAIHTLKIKPVNYFSPAKEKATEGWLINQTFYNRLKEHYTDNQIAFGNFPDEERTAQDPNLTKFNILGVISDFNYESLHLPIENFAFYVRPESIPNRIVLARFDQSHTKEVSQFIENEMAEFFPGQPVNYSFLDKQLNAQYTSEYTLMKLINSFSVLAIIVACIGLIGLSVFTTETRTKEIGIRKVNGARVIEMLALINKEFVTWILIAFIISVPIAWYAMNKWLESFAYKTDLSWWIFALSGIIALVIALLTVSWQSWKAATRNPVEALRYE
jgi:putative ABC transport system permease protein